jgi:hypothetical protein
MTLLVRFDSCAQCRGFSHAPHIYPVKLPPALLACALFLGCSGANAAKTIESAQSWNATAVLLGERWLGHSVADAYAIDALHSSSAALLEAKTKLLQDAKSDTTSHFYDIITSVNASAVSTAKMAKDVEAKNAPSFAADMDSLRAAARQLKQIAPPKQ